MKQPVREWVKSGGWRRPGSWFLATVLIALVGFYAVRATLGDSQSPVRLVVYAFSTQEEVLADGIFPAFEQAWEAKTGRDLELEAVFGASGTLAGQINLGAPADVALLSTAEHVDWLRLGRRVRRDAEPAIVGCTPMVIVTRPGNPWGIVDFSSLGQDGLRLVHSDPQSSGGGEWSVLAVYGSALFETGQPASARAQLFAVWDNARLLASSAREAMTLFELGAGDALVTYEQDALLALRRGVALEIVTPPRTIVARYAAVIVDDNVTRAERPVAQALLRYLASDAGLQILGAHHLRPPSCEGEGMAVLEAPFTVEELGGWSSAHEELVKGLWQTEIAPRLNLEPAPRLPEVGE
ncbi:MAG TPA: substrate-binding domain-containing protein [Anaerolineae bacterium]|nr:substrate-binding domain-containing protein [Anaerolineae bacterium]